MMIQGGFDESNSERRDRIFRKRIQTSEKLKLRIKHFFKDVDRDYSLTKSQKLEIKNNVVNNL